MLKTTKRKAACLRSLAGVLLMLGMGSAWAFAPAPQSVESILQQRAQATEDDKKLAALCVAYGERLLETSPDSNFGPLVKSWCAAAMSYPQAHSLSECAR